MNIKKNKYTKDWKEISKKLLKNSKCDICGRKAEIIHHKNKQKSDNSPENIIALCKRCHGSIHARDKFYTNNHSPKSYERIKREIKAKGL